ncbi:MAG: NfeD family protein [Phycisphaerales bacterium]|nr:NfeD family protein [Phycisphaerales bacterium]
MLDVLLAHDALVFTIPALVGTLVFLVKLGLMAIGGDGGDLDVDLELDGGLGDAGLGDAAHGDSTDAFNLLSIQAIATFLMGFGWGGLGAWKGLGWEIPTSLLAGAVFGAALMWLLGILMKLIVDLQSSGHVRLRHAVGVEGVVYTNIPAAGAGTGQVRVVVDQRSRIYTAASEGEALPTGTSVIVVQVREDRILSVARA